MQQQLVVEDAQKTADNRLQIFEIVMNTSSLKDPPNIQPAEIQQDVNCKLQFKEDRKAIKHMMGWKAARYRGYQQKLLKQT